MGPRLDKDAGDACHEHEHTWYRFSLTQTQMSGVVLSCFALSLSTARPTLWHDLPDFAYKQSRARFQERLGNSIAESSVR